MYKGGEVDPVSELEALRQELSAVDQDLLEGFRRRMEIVDRVAAHKAKTQAAVYVPEQEVRVLERIQKQVPEKFKSYAQVFFQTLMRLSRERQYEALRRVAFDPKGELQSPETFVILRQLRGKSLEAIETLYPKAQVMEADDLDSACSQVKRGLVDGSFLPLGKELLLAMEKHALCIQACVRVDCRYAVVGSKLRVPEESGTIGLLIRSYRMLSLILTILSDLELAVLRLESLQDEVFLLEFDAALNKGARALYQIEEEAAEVYVLGWYV